MRPLRRRQRLRGKPFRRQRLKRQRLKRQPLRRRQRLRRKPLRRQRLKRKPLRRQRSRRTTLRRKRLKRKRLRRQLLRRQQRKQLRQGRRRGRGRRRAANHATRTVSSWQLRKSLQLYHLTIQHLKGKALHPKWKQQQWRLPKESQRSSEAGWRSSCTLRTSISTWYECLYMARVGCPSIACTNGT